ncbi:MAG: Na(+)-translocating NADH-quinone reductase subunit A [Pirellulaceae bacterium]|nr:Na(+)-translocating NADH-quinone reductase subunit A [Pirellulaceae bacterium]
MVERFEVVKGLTVPIEGEPEQKVCLKPVRHVAIVSSDFLGMRPTMLVSEGDEVKLGQPVLLDKQSEGVVFVSPAGGRVKAINRAAKRRFLSMVIEVAKEEAIHEFDKIEASQVSKLPREGIIERIVETGLWTAFRTRPYSKVPSPKSVPHAIFINAMDSNPLAVNPAAIIRDAKEDFATGVDAITKLTDGVVFLCRAPGTETPGELNQHVRVVEFHGPHPSGLVGTHMHFLQPASAERINWHLDYQDVIAIGRAFTQGRLVPTRVISLAGPAVLKPRLIQSRLGACLSDLTADELRLDNPRIISGSVLCGRQMEELLGYLGRYHLQVACLFEGNQRELLGWQKPGFNKFSITRAFASAWTATKKFKITTSTEGSERAMVPIGTYERVVPLDVLPTLLLRALISRDTARAQELGCLELDEEDLALCTFVCPGKYDYGNILRDNLSMVEKEG